MILRESNESTARPPVVQPILPQSLATFGNNLYSGSRDRTIKHWSLPDGALLGSVNQAHEDWVCSLAVSESSSLLASGAQSARFTLSIQAIAKSHVHDRCSTHAHLLTTPLSHAFRLPSLTPSAYRTKSTSIPSHDKCVSAPTAMSHRNVGGRDGKVKLWRLPRIEICGILEGHSASINCLLCTHGLWGAESCIVSCSSDRTIRVWKNKGK